MASKKAKKESLIPQKNTLLFLAAVAFILIFSVLQTMTITRKAPITPTFEQEIEMIETQSESDEISAIETDLSNTNLQDLDKEIQDIIRELEL
jgi:hypothetical protein